MLSDARRSHFLVLAGALLGGALFLHAAAGTAGASLLDGLSAHWTFDKNFRSETNSIFNGTGAGNAVVTTVPGEYKFGGGALKLDGFGDLVSVANEVFPDGTSAFTVGVWANMQGQGAGGTTRVIYSTAPNYASEISIRDGNATTGYTDWYQQGIIDYIGDTTLISNNEWHHYAVSWDKAAGVLKYYLDGAKVFEHTGQGAKSPAVTDGFRIGSDRNNGRNFNGFIDDVAVWSRALTEAEVATLGAGAGSAVPLLARPTGLLAEYRFEAASGAPVGTGQSAVGRIDDTASAVAAGAPFHGTGYGGTLSYQPGAVGGHALSFTEATSPIDYVTLGAQPGMATLTEGDFSIETWFKTTDAGRSILVGSFVGGINAVNLEYYNAGGNGQVRGYIQNAELGVNTDLWSSGHGQISDGQWHHAAVVREGTTVRLYLDGVVVGTKLNDLTGSFTLSPAAVMYLGRDSRSDATRFNGALDEVRLWNKALTLGTLGVRTAEMAYYPVQTDGGLPVAPGQAAATVDDRAAHPFVYNGTAYGGTSLQYSADVPATILGSDGQPTTRSLSFDGSNDYVDLGNGTLLRDLPQGPFTIQAWIKTTDTNRAVILGSFDTVNRCVNFEIGSTTYGAGALRAYMEGDGGGVNLWGSRPVIDGQWHHAAWVYTGPGTNNVKLYVDGELDATGTYTGNPYSIAASSLVLGRDLRPSGVPYYGGLMDQVHIAGVALQPGQFLIRGAGEQNYYRMETDGGSPVASGQGAVVVDDTGLHPFTYNGAAQPAGSPRYRRDLAGAAILRGGDVLANTHALAFNGTSDYVELGNKTLLKTLPEGDFTIEFFAKTPPRTDRAVILGTYVSGATDALNIEIGGSVHGANLGHVRVFFQNADPAGNLITDFFGGAYLSDDEWHHVALVRSGAGTANDLVQLYVDYRLDGQRALNTGTFTIAADFFRLGRDARGTGYYYQGLLDEVRITAAALGVGDFLVAVPEPSTFVLLGLAAVGLLPLRRRRK